MLTMLSNLPSLTHSSSERYLSVIRFATLVLQFINAHFSLSCLYW
jgi:hypothetical protein